MRVVGYSLCRFSAIDLGQCKEEPLFLASLFSVSNKQVGFSFLGVSATRSGIEDVARSQCQSMMIRRR